MFFVSAHTNPKRQRGMFAPRPRGRFELVLIQQPAGAVKRFESARVKRGHSTYWTSLAFLVVEEMTQGRAVWQFLSASEYRRMGCPGQDCGGAI